jgi:hypothetical protein
MAKAKQPRATAAKPPVVQPTANPARGEHELTLEGVPYRLRPSHDALSAIEQKTGRSMLALVRLGDTGDLSIAQLGIIAAELIRAGAKDDLTRNVGAQRIGELIFEEGVPHVTARLTLCLLDAVTGGRTAKGEAKAPAA